MNYRTFRFQAPDPTRVMVREGCATNPQAALRDHGIEPDVIFVRNDGWMLGAPIHLALQAQRLWADQWVNILYLIK